MLLEVTREFAVVKSIHIGLTSYFDDIILKLIKFNIPSFLCNFNINSSLRNIKGIPNRLRLHFLYISFLCLRIFGKVFIDQILILILGNEYTRAQVSCWGVTTNIIETGHAFHSANYSGFERQFTFIVTRNSACTTLIQAEDSCLTCGNRQHTLESFRYQYVNDLSVYYLVLPLTVINALDAQWIKLFSKLTFLIEVIQ